MMVSSEGGRVRVTAGWVMLLALVLASLDLRAQERQRVDRWSELWLDAGVRGKLGKGWKGIGEMGYRTGDELGTGRQFFLNGEVRRKLNKYLDAAFEQRAAFRSNASDRFRSGLMLMVGERFGRFPLGYRLNYQHVWAGEDPARNVLRNRFEMGYDVRGFQFDPQGSIEFFTALGGDRDPWGEGSGLVQAG